MPKVLEILGYIIYFWSNEGEPQESLHVHISHKPPQPNSTKIWIDKDGNCTVANNNSNIPDKLLKKMLKTIKEYHTEIEEAWKNHFSKENVSYYCNEEENDFER